MTPIVEELNHGDLCTGRAGHRRYSIPDQGRLVSASWQAAHAHAVVGAVSG